MDDKEWIKILKIGDKVATSEKFRERKMITTVTKITPDGIIKTTHGHQFNQMGEDVIRGDVYLHQLPDEILLELRKRGFKNENKRQSRIQ